MIPLDKDLQTPKNSILEFKAITIRVLDYLPNVLSGHNEKNGYKIHSSLIAGTTKFIRPINQKLFIYKSSDFAVKFAEFETLLVKLKYPNNIWSNQEKDRIDSVLY